MLKNSQDQEEKEEDECRNLSYQEKLREQREEIDDIEFRPSKQLKTRTRLPKRLCRCKTIEKVMREEEITTICSLTGNNT